MTMRTKPLHQPALLACAALLGAMIGSPLAGAAASVAHKISGSDIKKASIAGNRMKKDTVTDKQVKESSLKTVPKASKASKATDALALGGIAPGGFVHGSANQVQFRVTKPPNTGNFTLFELQDGGTVVARCSGDPEPGVDFQNSTGHNQDLVVTFVSSAGVGTYGPPFLNGADASVDRSAFVTDITAMSQTSPVKTANVVIMAGVDSGSCFWDVQGQSSLVLSR